MKKREKQKANARFEEMLPKIQEKAWRAFRYLKLVDREEMTAESIANAYQTYCRLVERDKVDVAYATPLAEYAIRQVRCGRRFGNPLNVKDITSPYCQRVKRVRGRRLDECGNTREDWQEAVMEDKTAGPAEIAAIRIDFAEWLGSLKPKLQRIAKTLAMGEATKSTATMFELTPARISQIRRELRDGWYTFQGEPMAA